MATNPETVVPQTPERDPLAVLRDEGRAKMVAALRTRKATLQQIKDIAKEHSIKIENEDALKKNIAYTRIPGSDLSLVGEFIFGSTPPQEAPAATISQYEPTFQEQAYTQIYNAARSLGADKSRAQYFAERLAGRRGGDISLLELTPAAALTDVPTGIEEVQRGLRFDEPGTAALGALQTGLGLLEAVPVVGAGVKAAKPTLRQARNVVALADVARRTPTGDASRQAIEALSPSQVPPTPITPMARIAQAPEIPPTRITPRAAAAAPEVPPVAPARAAVEPTIPVTPSRVAAAERVAETMDQVPEVSVEFAGNVNLSKLDTKEDVSQLLNAVAQSNAEFMAARRGVMSIPEIESLADKVSLETILGRKVGQSMSAEQIVAARRAVAATSDDVIAKAREWKANPGDENLKNAALEAIMRQAAFQEQLSGATAEIGRALRAMRETQAGGRSDALRAIVGDVTNIRDGDKIDQILDLVSTLDDPAEAAKFIGDMSKPNFRDKILEGWINALLAGPGTHAVNVTSNALFALSKLPEEILASAIGKITRSTDRITAGEVGARSVGMVQGVLDGTRAGAKVMRGEKLSDDVSKTELTRRESISGVKGEIVRLPSKALEVEDEFFKAVNRRSELAAEAYRLAAKEAKGDKAKFEELYRGYLNNPTDKMRKQADEYARYATFQNQLIGWPKDVQAFANKYPEFRFLVPFIRTPVNILKAARDRSLLAPTTRQFWAEVRAGGRRRDRALSKVSLGTGITGAIGYLYGQDLVTGGGPSDPGERAALLATGWQPYSFKIGDTYYSYARLEPISTVLGVSADFFSLKDSLRKDEAENVPVLLAMSLAKNVLDKTFLQGISNFFEAVIDPDRYGERYLEGLAASFIPNVLPQIARGVDPTLRETETFADVLQSRIPFASQALPARLDAWGDEIVRVGYTTPEDSPLWGSLTAVTNILNPVRTSQIDASSPVKTEVARLGMKVSLPQKTITVSGVDIELTPEEHKAYVSVSGRAAKSFLDRAVQTSGYKAFSEEEKKDYILDELRDFRAETRKALEPIVVSRVLEK